ncbi:MAG: hypothetical protein AAFR55_01900 [Pseudomonadota bacterium]
MGSTAELKSALKSFSSVFKASGSAQAAKDLTQLADCLDGDIDDARDAIAKFEAELSETSPEAAPRTVDAYVDELRSAGLDGERFDRVFQSLKTDRAMKKDDVLDVMRGYVGEHVRAKSKTDALKQIERRFTLLRYDANAERQAASAPF